jgi:serine/threonine protein kinase
MTITPGTRLGSFEIAALIGVGGMGEVYRATDTNLKRPIAIKVLRHAVSQEPIAWRGSSAKRKCSRR